MRFSVVELNFIQNMQMFSQKKWPEFENQVFEFGSKTPFYFYAYLNVFHLIIHYFYCIMLNNKHFTP